MRHTKNIIKYQKDINFKNLKFMLFMHNYVTEKNTMVTKNTFFSTISNTLNRNQLKVADQDGFEVLKVSHYNVAVSMK